MAVAERARKSAAPQPAASEPPNEPPPDDSAAALNHVLGRLAVLDQRARAAGGEPTQPHELLAATEAAADEAQQHGAWLPLRDLAGRLRLTSDELDLLLAASAPHLDPDVADVLDPGRHQTGPEGEVRAHVVVKRLGLPAIAVHRLLDSDGALVRLGLVVVNAGRRLSVPPAVIEHLLVLPRRPGDALAAALAPAGQIDGDDTDRLATALRSGLRFCYLQDPLGGLAPAIAAAAMASVGLDTMHLDLDEMDDDDRVDDVLGEALVRAHLDGVAIVAGPASKVVAIPDRIARLAAGDVPFVLYGALPWRPGLLTTVPWQMAPVPATKDDRVVVWEQALEVAAGQPGADLTAIPDRDDIARAVGHLHLSPPAVNRAVLSAGLQALGEQRALDVDDLITAARTQSGEALQRLARRITPRVGWDDLVVPAGVVEQLEEICTRARQRDLVMGTWKVGGGSSRKRGTVSLFGGPPGTGKSLAAEVVGAALGLEIYQVNLATVVDKYVGETEKNLDRIFRAAEGVNCLLFFDEADALFGRRSEVQSAQDKYANVEVAFLLQRLEDFDGVAVLASNLRGNLDDAFRRRIDVIVDFPVPDETARLQLWRTCLGPHVQLADDVDLAVCATFDLAGGDIRNVAVGAAMAAAEAGQPIGMAHLVRAVQSEYRKLGRLADHSAFAKVKKYAES
ncbi:MAG: hypothetical protein QOD07_2850 [Frankiaceae bacterium]|nr:hypothetical protein [Frankiaceae bacterium]